MTKAEFLLALSQGPDDAEVVVADYVGEDLEIGDIIYFPKDKVFWIRTADLVAEEEDDSIEDESVERELEWEKVTYDAGVTCNISLIKGTTCSEHGEPPQQPQEGTPLPMPPSKPIGRQRAA